MLGSGLYITLCAHRWCPVSLRPSETDLLTQLSSEVADTVKAHLTNAAEREGDFAAVQSDLEKAEAAVAESKEQHESMAGQLARLREKSLSDGIEMATAEGRVAELGTELAEVQRQLEQSEADLQRQAEQGEAALAEAEERRADAARQADAAATGGQAAVDAQAADAHAAAEVQRQLRDALAVAAGEAKVFAAEAERERESGSAAGRSLAELRERSLEDSELVGQQKEELEELQQRWAAADKEVSRLGQQLQAQSLMASSSGEQQAAMAAQLEERAEEQRHATMVEEDLEESHGQLAAVRAELLAAEQEVEEVAAERAALQVRE